MKTKTLLIALSFIGFLFFSLTSCSEDGNMDIGETEGEDPHTTAKSTNIQPIDTISVPDPTKD